VSRPASTRRISDRWRNDPPGRASTRRTASPTGGSFRPIVAMGGPMSANERRSLPGFGRKGPDRARPSARVFLLRCLPRRPTARASLAPKCCLPRARGWPVACFPHEAATGDPSSPTSRAAPHAPVARATFLRCRRCSAAAELTCYPNQAIPLGPLPPTVSSSPEVSRRWPRNGKRPFLCRRARARPRPNSATALVEQTRRAAEEMPSARPEDVRRLARSRRFR